jgi:hypothetical protein
MEASPPPLSAPTPRTPRWRDFVLYLVVGFSAFVLAMLTVGAAIQQPGSWLILAIGLANFVSLAGTVYVIGLRGKRLTLAELGLWPVKWSWRWLILVVGVTLLLLPIRLLLALAALFLLEGGLESLQGRTNLLLPGLSWPNFLASLIAIGVLAPISEELFFRGALFGWLRRHVRLWVAVLVSAGLFGLAHFDSVGVMISSFIMGIAVALAYEATHSLWTAIAIHVFNNSLAVILAYLALWLMQVFPQLRTL